MKTTVKVHADESGRVVIPTENPKFGYIKVSQQRFVHDDNGFARKKEVSALILGEIEDLKDFGWKKDQQVEGKIVIREQLTPFNKKDPERDYKVAGETGIICCVDGQPIYRKHIFTTNSAAEDVLIAHDNGDAIREAYQSLEQNESEEKFSI